MQSVCADKEQTAGHCISRLVAWSLSHKPLLEPRETQLYAVRLDNNGSLRLPFNKRFDINDTDKCRVFFFFFFCFLSIQRLSFNDTESNANRCQNLLHCGSHRKIQRNKRDAVDGIIVVP